MATGPTGTGPTAGPLGTLGGPLARERVWTLPLVLCSVAVALILLWAAVDRFAPRSFEGMLAVLADADLEGDERRQLLRDLVALGSAAQDRRLQVCGFMAAVALDDEAAFRPAAGDPAVPPFGQDDVAYFDTAALGDEVLAGLLAAMAAELAADAATLGDQQRGYLVRARRRYEQVAASSRLFHLRLAAKLCAEGLARLH